MAEEFEETAVQTRTESQVATPAALPMSEIQLRMARENPRDENAIVERVSKELIAHPAFAEDGFYSIPYQDKRKGIITFVEGLSIRAAEHVWTRWGNCTVAARIADDRGNKIMVQGMFFDYETGLLNLSDLEILKIGKTREGGSYQLSGDKLRLAVQSGESKVKRNAFLGGLPVWIKEGYLSTCRDLILIQPKGKEIAIAERIAKAKGHFSKTYAVTPKDVDIFIEKVTKENPSMPDQELLRYLIGMNNAIKDGNVKLNFVFGEDREQAPMPKEKKEKPNGKATESAAAATAEAPGDAQE